MKKLTIITPVLNARDKIFGCIESIRSQTVHGEHIIVDGASTDDTLDVIDRYKGKDTRVISEPDRGLYDAINKGIREASGEIIGILHADDSYVNRSVLSTVIDVLGDDRFDCCYGDLMYVDPVNLDRVVRYWKSGRFLRRDFYLGWMPPHPTFFARRSVYNKYGLYNLALGSSADYELMLRFLFKFGISPAYIPEVLVKMRTGGISNASLMNRLMAHRCDRHAWKINGLKPYPWTLLLKPIRKIGQYKSVKVTDCLARFKKMQIGV